MNNIAAKWPNTMVNSCPLRSITFENAFLYDLTISMCFVLSLYILVPARIRNLDRNNEILIKWRTLASSISALVSVATYPLIMCSFDDKDGDDQNSSVLQLLGINFNIFPIVLVFAHTCILYFGPILASLLEIQEIVSLQRRSGGSSTNHFEIFNELCLSQIFDPFWPQIRNLIAAPILEEIVFRACLLGPLAHSLGSNTIKIVWISPLFFGVAHMHHVILKWGEKQSLSHILILFLFQFTYTTLFGAYATYCFLKTNSLLAIVLCHIYCNYMGLPDFSFLRPQYGRLSPIHRYRKLLIFAYLVGLAGFIWGFGKIIPWNTANPSGRWKNDQYQVKLSPIGN